MKNSRILTLLLLLIIVGCNPTTKQQPKEENTKSNESSAEVMVQDDWITLFDGSSLDNWTGWESAEVPGVWSITENGELFCRSLAGDDAKPGEKGYIVSKDQYGNFHLKLEWKISEGGNSGIFYLADKSLGGLTSSSPEMQVLDNDKHPDAKKGKDGNRKAGSLYDLIPAVPQNAKPVGEWNTAEVIVKDRHIIHKQNGEVVVEVDLDTDAWKELVAGSKFPKVRENWYQVPQRGYLALQDHGDDVWYRNIMILEL
ncbi:MAG: DUF1080 domain-containing protein [Bacteroidota bacterium]